MKGFPWDYMGQAKRRRTLYPGGAAGARVPLLPDSASLEEMARAAGRAAAAEIAATTPNLVQQARLHRTQLLRAPLPPNVSYHERCWTGTEQTTRIPRTSTTTWARGWTGAAGAAAEQTTRIPRGRPQPPGSMPTQGVVDQSGVPKRPRLLLDRPQASDASAAASSPSSSLYPPGFAGIKSVHGDVPTEELAGVSSWSDEMAETMAMEFEDAGEWEEEPDDGDQPPNPSPEELWRIDREADYTGITRLMEMGVARHPKLNEDVASYPRLTTKMVRDWRKRPSWVRRSRLVGREFKFLSDWTAKMFAPASSLAMVRSFVTVALSRVSRSMRKMPI